MTLFLEVLEGGWIYWIKIQNPEREAMNICFVGSWFCIVRWVRGNHTYLVFMTLWGLSETLHYPAPVSGMPLALKHTPKRFKPQL